MNTGTSRGSITYRSSATSTNGLRRSFGPDGCQAVVDGAKCGETKNLQIIAEFKRMYEDKMKQIDDIAGGDCIQAKVNLQQEWIKDLTDQNEMLVKVVEELEVEAAERVTMLEKKLQQTAKSAGDKMERVQNDMNNLLELIRRAQADGVWNADGLQFYCLDIDDVIGSSCSGILVATNDSVKQKEDMLKEKERRIKELENQLKPYVESGKSPQDYNTIKKDYKELEQSMLDMRDALTAEVADKHDTVLCLRREVHLLEEQCRKADQQTHFKDDIIKELRKEIKQLKQQQEAGDCLQVALPVDFVSQEVPVHHRTFGSRSLPLRIERTDKEVQTANGSVNTPNWMGIVNDIIERTEHEKTLIVALETECRNLVKQLGNKDKYIFDQNDLIVLLVQKLYIVYRTLRDLEEKTNVMAPNGKVQKLKDALTDAKEQLASAKELADSCGKERDDLKKKLDTAQEQLDFQNVEIAGLKDQLAACLEETEKIKGQNSQETDKLKGMLADKTAEHNALKEQKEQESKDLQDKLDAHKQEMETLKKNHEQASKDLQDKLDAHRDELDTLKKDHATAKEDLHKQLGSTKEEMDDLKNQHAAKQNELLDKHAAEVETLKNEKLKELENFENQHKQTLAQLEQLRVELEKTKMEHKVCMDKIKDLGEENTLLKEKTERKKNVSSAQVQNTVRPVNKATGLDGRLCAVAAVSTDRAPRRYEDFTSSSYCTNASANTDTTWSSIVICDEPECVAIAVNTMLPNCRDSGFSAGTNPPAPTTNKSVQCIPGCPGSRSRNRQCPLDVFTFANSYLDPSSAPKKAGTEVSASTCSSDCDVMKVLEMLCPKKVELAAQNKAASPPKCQCGNEADGNVPRKADRDTSESSRSSPRTLDTRKPAQEAMSTDAIDPDDSDVMLRGVPCDFPSDPRQSQQCKRLRFAKSVPVKGKRNEVQATRDSFPQRCPAYPSDNRTPSFQPCTCARPKENPPKSREPALATTPTNTPRSQVQDSMCGSCDKTICNSYCQSAAMQRDASVAAPQPNRAAPFGTKNAIVGVCTSVLRTDTCTGTEGGSRAEVAILAPCSGTCSVESKSTGSVTSTETEESLYEDTVLSQSRDQVLYVRQCTSPAQDLESVVHDLNVSVSRIIKMSPEIDAKEKIAKLEEQLRAALKQKEQAVEYERNRRNQEVENLKLTIQHMENVIKNKQANSENLQCAVDLYSDSITILEESKQHYETEIAQQQVTIANLQDALVITKRDLEELQLKFKQDQDHKCELLNILDIGVRDLEATCLHYYDQLTSLSKTVKRLRDENLSLEVAKSELIQDTGMLESRLLKYQQEERLISEFVLGLKEEINRLKYENHADSMKMVGLKNDIGFYIDQAAEIKNIMQHILGVGDCENPICNPDGATEDLVLTAQEVERFVQSLQGQVNLMLASLEREQKMNQVNTARIDELQNILGIKNMELNRSIEMYQDLKVKLESCAVRNKKLEEAVVELQEQLADTELDQQFQEQKVDLCHGELDICLNNLNCIKMKLRQQCQTMTQKIDELTELKSDFNSQNTDLEMYKRDLECTRVMHRDEVLELKRVIRELTDKLQGSQVKVEELTDELNNVQEIIVNMTQRESKLQQELSVKDQDFGNKLQVWKVKEARLLEQISQLEQQLRAVHNELAGRTHQIDSAKCKLQQISNDAHMRVQMGQEELLAAKDEINALRQVHEKLQVENDALQQTVHSLQATLAHHESVNATVKKQLDKCMCDLKKIETDKYFVEQKNEKLMQELDKMQATLRSRCENMLCLEEELNEMKNDREEIRKESHHVVCNVRAWLEEQKKVNDQLKDKLLKKNALIIKYQQASTSNMDVIGPPNPNIKKTLPPVCAEVCNRRQRGGTVSSRVFNTCNNIKRGSTGLWSLNSRGSDTDSPRSSICSDSADWCDVDASEATTAPCDEPGTQIWIQRVESMTEKLERTNRYWKRKISDSEFMVTRDK